MCELFLNPITVNLQMFLAFQTISDWESTSITYISGLFLKIITWYEFLASWHIYPTGI